MTAQTNQSRKRKDTAMTAELSTRTIREDHRLEQQTEQSREELARLRWHWTLDESNPKRVTIREYARQVGRAWKTVADMVNGYAEWSVRGAPHGELPDYIARAKLTGDRLTVTEAVADAHGITVETARRHRADEIRDVTAAARERVERSETPTTVADEARKIAAGRVRGAAARERVEQERRKHHTVRYLKVEAHIATARRNVLNALNEAQDVEFTDEERELIAHAADELRAILKLIDLRIIGDTTVDWDGELAKLAES